MWPPRPMPTALRGGTCGPPGLSCGYRTDPDHASIPAHADSPQQRHEWSSRPLSWVHIRFGSCGPPSPCERPSAAARVALPATPAGMERIRFMHPPRPMPTALSSGTCGPPGHSHGSKSDLDLVPPPDPCQRPPAAARVALPAAPMGRNQIWIMCPPWPMPTAPRSGTCCRPGHFHGS